MKMTHFYYFPHQQDSVWDLRALKMPLLWTGAVMKGELIIFLHAKGKPHNCRSDGAFDSDVGTVPGFLSPSVTHKTGCQSNPFFLGGLLERSSVPCCNSSLTAVGSCLTPVVSRSLCSFLPCTSVSR